MFGERVDGLRGALRIGGYQRPHGSERVEQEVRFHLRLKDRQAQIGLALLRARLLELDAPQVSGPAFRFGEVGRERESAIRDEQDEQVGGGGDRIAHELVKVPVGRDGGSFLLGSVNAHQIVMKVRGELSGEPREHHAARVPRPRRADVPPGAASGGAG